MCDSLLVSELYSETLAPSETWSTKARNCSANPCRSPSSTLELSVACLARAPEGDVNDLGRAAGGGASSAGKPSEAEQAVEWPMLGRESVKDNKQVASVC